MATKAIVGQKVGMTQIWDENNRMIPVTVLEIEPLRVVQIRTPEKDGYSALQVTFGHKKASKLTKPVAGQYAKSSVEPGERVSIHPLQPVTFWRSEGLKYPLDAVKLAPGVRTGTSNEALTGPFTIVPEEGVHAPYLLILPRAYLASLIAKLLLEKR